MSCTNILSAGTGVPSGGASEPTGLGTLNVPDSAQVCCQARSMSPASSAVVAVLRGGLVGVGGRPDLSARRFCHVNRV